MLRRRVLKRKYIYLIPGSASHCAVFLCRRSGSKKADQVCSVLNCYTHTRSSLLFLAHNDADLSSLVSNETESKKDFIK